MPSIATIRLSEVPDRGFLPADQLGPQLTRLPEKCLGPIHMSGNATNQELTIGYVDFPGWRVGGHLFGQFWVPPEVARRNIAGKALYER